MDEYADLSITLSRRPEDRYWAQFSFSRPDFITESPPIQCEVSFDLLELRKKPAAQMGEALRDCLFAEQSTREYFKLCEVAAQTSQLRPRVRLIIDRSAPELHTLRWETLVHPTTGKVLSLDQNFLFSRFLFSLDWRRVELQPKGKLRALVVVANPNDLEDYSDLPDNQSLAAVDVEGEMNRAKASLQGIDTVDFLESRPAEKGRVTLEALCKRLEEGYDILYLVCHGALDRVKHRDLTSPLRSFLWLENKDGDSDRVDGEALVERIQLMLASRRPRLVVLASCQSSGKGTLADPRHSDDRGVLSALGPRLAEVGIPAVVAMQGNILMETVETFMPAFFKMLLDTGSVDLAMASGRSLIRESPDWSAPVLFLRLRGGQLWYKSSVSGMTSELFEFWNGIISGIRDKRCTPVIGEDLLDFIINSTHEIARDWAARYQYPLVQQSQEELPRVAQFIASYQGGIPANNLVRYLIARLRDRYRALIPVNVLDTSLDDSGLNTLLDDLEVTEQAQLLDRIISLVGEDHRVQNPDNDPYAILASLPVKIYITTNFDHLLEDALRANAPTKKEPQSLFYCWRQSLNTEKNRKLFDSLVDPTVKQPLVYHLFGSLDEPASLVLTEDDYFDYLMWINKSTAQIPDQVMAAWMDNALLFLGFQMSDWPFRMLFRSILDEERRNRRTKNYHSLCVQIQPGDDNIQPGRARKYLEKFFSNELFNIYWGGATDFMKELHTQWKAGRRA